MYVPSLLCDDFLMVCQDVRNLLSEWKDQLEDCERIFIRASVSNRKIFMGYDGAVLQKGNIYGFFCQ